MHSVEIKLLKFKESFNYIVIHHALSAIKFALFLLHHKIQSEQAVQRYHQSSQHTVLEADTLCDLKKGKVKLSG